MKSYEKRLTPAQVKNLADRLSQLPSVARLDTRNERQGGTIAHALSGFETSFSVVLYVLLPKLLDETQPSEQLDDVLLEIGEELRHILYHVRDTRYFQYLCPEKASL
jgi:hypothetical protein